MDGHQVPDIHIRWFQAIRKICSSNWITSGWILKKKMWNHHLVIHIIPPFPRWVFRGCSGATYIYIYKYTYTCSSPQNWIIFVPQKNPKQIGVKPPPYQRLWILSRPHFPYEPLQAVCLLLRKKKQLANHQKMSAYTKNESKNLSHFLVVIQFATFWSHSCRLRVTI